MAIKIQFECIIDISWTKVFSVNHEWHTIRSLIDTSIGYTIITSHNVQVDSDIETNGDMYSL